MSALGTALPGTAVRILATTDLGAAFIPVAASLGTAGTCAGVAALLDAERARRPTAGWTRATWRSDRSSSCWAAAGLPASALIEADGVRVDVVGLTHPPRNSWPGCSAYAGRLAR